MNKVLNVDLNSTLLSESVLRARGAPKEKAPCVVSQRALFEKNLNEGLLLFDRLIDFFNDFVRDIDTGASVEVVRHDQVVLTVLRDLI